MNKIRRIMSGYNMVSAGDSVLVGLSGGPDSVCLLYVLKELAPRYRLKLYAAHLNHGLRGKEADCDERFCGDLCRRIGVPIYTKKVKIVKKGGSWEDSARRERYKFFEDAAKRFGAKKIALGHNADDQIETFLMRLLRGAGTKGLSGIPPKRKSGRFEIIRPLIDTWKEEILDFLKKKNISYREDSTNRKTEFFRNRVRHELIPFLQRYNPNIKNILLNTGKNLAMVDEFLEGRLKTGPENLAIRRTAKNFCPDLNLESERVNDILALISSKDGSKSLCLPKGVKAIREYAKLIFTKKDEKIGNFEYKLKVPGKVKIVDCNLLITSNLCRKIKKIIRNPFEVMLDYDKILCPLIIRNRRPGDVFQPIGFKGTKKIKDIFINEKIPERIRDRIPLFVSKGEICWVPGYRIGEKFKVRDETKRVVRIKTLGMENLWQT